MATTGPYFGSPGFSARSSLDAVVQVAVHPSTLIVRAGRGKVKGKLEKEAGDVDPRNGADPLRVLPRAA